MLHRMKTKLLFLAATTFCAWASLAQMPGSGSPTGISTAIVKLFGDITAFTAKAEVQVLDSAQGEMMKVPMDFALLDNKIRAEIDMSQMKSKQLPENAIAGLKQVGMSHVISVIRPDKKLIYVIYPDQKSVVSMPLSKEDAEAAERKPKLQKTELGKETIEGHPCVKNKVVVSDDKGQLLEATTWNATDLKEFPIQIQTKEKDSTSIVRYKQVQFVKPEAKQFDPPAGYTQYTDTMEMMQAIMKKQAGAGATKQGP
jgi:hypothetical protein